jgi:protein-disulfide isomerase
MKSRPSNLSLALALSITTSTGVIAYRAKTAAVADAPVPDIEFVSDGGSSKGIPASQQWQVLVFKNYQCPACRQRTAEFESFAAEHEGRVRVSFRTYILPKFDLALPAAKVSEASKILGKYDAVNKVLLEGPILTKEAIERANAIISGSVTPAIEAKVKTEIANHAISAAKFRFDGIPAIYAISPGGGVYKATHMGALDGLMADENSHRPDALMSK